MVYDAWRARGGTLDRDLATILYVGAIFDTGCFRYSSGSRRRRSDCTIRAVAPQTRWPSTV